MSEKQDALSERLMQATGIGDVEAMRDLIDQGADVNYANRFGRTPLIQAAYTWVGIRGFSAGVKLLLESGANTEKIDLYERTALMYAAIHGATGMADLLLDAGAGIDNISLDGETAEDYAQSAGYKGIVTAVQDARLERLAAAEETGRAAAEAASEEDLRFAAKGAQNRLRGARRPKIRFKP